MDIFLILDWTKRKVSFVRIFDDDENIMGVRYTFIFVKIVN